MEADGAHESSDCCDRQQHLDSLPSYETEYRYVRKRYMLQDYHMSLASPETIREWSCGEVIGTYTINYRNLKPELGGLFCERIFGPIQDWVCSCGKVQQRDTTCERCGVESVTAESRRFRMGHVELAVPVAHVWFVRGTIDYICVLLDISPRLLDRVIYFGRYLVTGLNEAKREEAIKEIREITDETIDDLRVQAQLRRMEIGHGAEERIREIDRELHDQLREEEDQRDNFISLLSRLKIGTILTEAEYRELQDFTLPGVVEAKMGAEAVLDVIAKVDLKALQDGLREQLSSPSQIGRRQAEQRLRIISQLIRCGVPPTWMFFTALPVIPPGMRPIIQLGDGSFATSDLNDLYRRVINRNNRLKRLLGLGAPEIVVHNEKRHLQEAVDALLDNGRGVVVVTGDPQHKLKSLRDELVSALNSWRTHLNASLNRQRSNNESRCSQMGLTSDEERERVKVRLRRAFLGLGIVVAKDDLHLLEEYNPLDDFSDDLLSNLIRRRTRDSDQRRLDP